MNELTLQDIFTICEEAKAKNCKALFRCIVSEDSEEEKPGSLPGSKTQEQWDLIGLATDYLWKENKKAGATFDKNTPDVFAGVYLDILGMHNREVGDTFLIDSGSFKKGEYTKRALRTATILKGSKEDVLLYMDHPSKPDVVTQILDGRIQVL